MCCYILSYKTFEGSHITSKGILHIGPPSSCIYSLNCSLHNASSSTTTIIRATGSAPGRAESGGAAMMSVLARYFELLGVCVGLKDLVW